MRLKALAAAAAVLTVAALGGCASPDPSASSTPARLQLPDHAEAYFFGDSWTAGVSAAEGAGFPQITSKRLGWKPTIDGVGGSGYLRTYIPGTDTFPVRADKIPDTAHADVVVVEGGLNDQQSDLTPFRATVVKTIAELQRRFPATPIIVLGPAATSLPLTPVLARIDDLERQAARQARVYYISPIKEEWFTSENIASIMDPATNHPNTAGHALFGDRLARAIEALPDSPST